MRRYNTKEFVFLIVVLIFTITSAHVTDATPRHFVILGSNKGVDIKESTGEIKERELVEFHLDYGRTGANQDHEPGKGRP
ncbi:hypothetical protein CARUB_v10021239mg [Capsella rubella]|uniref:Uncharacterized protein n=1 Tax=Capsella rubella TaxID=81985 RepID=R0GJP0_9BRAS|nr:hypothetical protein CARUB_v10021239mg [Capsella rubella]